MEQGTTIFSEVCLTHICKECINDESNDESEEIEIICKHDFQDAREILEDSNFKCHREDIDSITISGLAEYYLVFKKTNEDVDKMKKEEYELEKKYGIIRSSSEKEFTFYVKGETPIYSIEEKKKFDMSL